MFSVTQPAPNRIDLELSGKLSDQELKLGFDELIAVSTDFTQGKMLYRITDFSFPSLKALALEITRLPALFKLISRFDRVAIVADKRWLRRSGEIKGALIPGITVQGFDTDEEELAEKWLLK